MDFKERKMDFQEADRRYAELARRHEDGSINDEEFDAERKRLMVLDKQGRWWAKSGTTGEWKYHDGKAWMPGVPPGYQPQPGEASAEDTPERESQPEKTEPSLPESQAREVVDGGGRRRSRMLLLLIPAFLLLLLLIGGVAYVLSRGTDGTDGTSDGGVAVPDLVGASSVEEAQKTAGGDFEVAEGDGVESREPIGAVVEQDPKSGDHAGKGSTISVNVSKGVSVPDVEGNGRDEAVQTLEEKGLKVNEKTEESSADDEGKVTGQDPGGGETVEAGSSVEITVGKGPAGTDTNNGADAPASPEPAQTPAPENPASPEPAQTSVPDVIGESAEEAGQTLANAGFDSSVETVQSDQTAGTVVSTDPAPGTVLDPSSGGVIIGSSSGPTDSNAGSQYVAPQDDN